jgi:hypothetical protein
MIGLLGSNLWRLLPAELHYLDFAGRDPRDKLPGCHNRARADPHRRKARLTDSATLREARETHRKAARIIRDLAGVVRERREYLPGATGGGAHRWMPVLAAPSRRGGIALPGAGVGLRAKRVRYGTPVCPISPLETADFRDSDPTWQVAAYRFSLPDFHVAFHFRPRPLTHVDGQSKNVDCAMQRRRPRLWRTRCEP